MCLRGEMQTKLRTSCTLYFYCCNGYVLFLLLLLLLLFNLWTPSFHYFLLIKKVVKILRFYPLYIFTCSLKIDILITVFSFSIKGGEVTLEKLKVPHFLPLIAKEIWKRGIIYSGDFLFYREIN